MTDRRVKDLSYGRLGKPIYDSQVGWTFSQDTNLEQTIQRVLPLKEQLRPSIHSPQNGQQTAQPPFKKLVAKNPDLYPAEALAKVFSRSNQHLDWKNQGSLLSIGKGLDNERLTSQRSSFPILAMPFGDAGHILRIVRPRIEKRTWEKKSSVSLPLFVLESSDEGYYNIGSAGTIEQITFSEEENGLGSWLAVRQSTITTILRISYSEDEDQSSTIDGVSAIKHTNLLPVSVVTFPIAQNPEQNHADIAFNSLYNRQVAIVDQSGRWSIWDNEPRHSKKTTPRLVLGKGGHILDDYNPDPTLRLPEHSLPDGWHRIFWVCNLTTILVSSRTHLAVFDIRSNPARMNSTEFMVAKGLEIILDVKRSLSNLSHVFVLTTSRLYWIEVVPPGESINGVETSGAVNMLLSYRHFRNENDDSMRLATFQDDLASVFICSSLNHMVNFYSFSIDNGDDGAGARQPRSAHGYFYLSGNEDETFNRWDKSPRTILLMPNILEKSPNSNGPEGLGLQYLEGGVRFVQPLILTLDLGLSSTLCALISDIQSLTSIEPPLIKISRTYRRLGNRRAIEGFIVNDGEADLEDDIPLLLDRHSAQNSSVFLMSWQHIFESVFMKASEKEETEKAVTFLSRVIGSIQQGLEEDQMAMRTLLEASSLSRVSENLEELTKVLNGFFDSLPNDTEALSNLIISNTSVCPGVGLPLEGDFDSSDLMKVYEDLVDKWIASLPSEASTAVRGSKFRIIRQISAELFFSAVTISLQSKTSIVPAVLPQKDDEPAGDSVGFSTRESSPATFFSAQTTLATRQDPESTLQTPTRTPSTYSRLTSASGLEEDPAISRLRQYATSIKPRSDVAKSKIMSEWPTVPGINPNTYVYKPPVESDEEDSAPESSQSRRDSARRKKRTEKFLQKNVESSRRISIPSGSQPVVAQPAFSSQPTEEVSMTQPDRGNFGSRKAKGKKKQRTAGF